VSRPLIPLRRLAAMLAVSLAAWALLIAAGVAYGRNL
jgi:hypothetical protein